MRRFSLDGPMTYIYQLVYAPKLTFDLLIPYIKQTKYDCCISTRILLFIYPYEPFLGKEPEVS